MLQEAEAEDFKAQKKEMEQEEVNTTVSPRDARTPLHLAAALGNLPITQLLIWVRIMKWNVLMSFIDEMFQCNSDVTATHHDGRTCVTHAGSSGAMVSGQCWYSLPPNIFSLQDVVSLLLAAGCPDPSPGPGGTLPRRRGSGPGRSKEIASSVLWWVSLVRCCHQCYTTQLTTADRLEKIILISE